MGKRLTKEKFIEKAKLIFGDMYDYSQVEYKSCHEKVDIICKKHGIFKQSTTQHLDGKHCYKCSRENRRSDTETFIKKANLKHNYFYSYDLVKYITDKDKVKIMCPTHGVFEQCPRNHLTGKGCPKCNKFAKLTHDEFLKKAYLKYGDLYDYSKTEYVESKKKITVICKIHGEFNITPSSFLFNKGCGECGKRSSELNRRLSKDDLIEDMKRIHNNFYDYSDVNFINTATKINIICPLHGTFSQTPMSHKRGHGCPICRLNTIAKANREFPHGWCYTLWEKSASISKNFDSFKVYIIKCYNESETFYKIGKTYRTIKQRFGKYIMSYNYEVITIFQGTAQEMSELENKLHVNHKMWKYLPTIEFNGRYECFSEINI